MSNKISTPVRARFAPSPTGLTHLGSARTALYDYLIAKQSGGQFVLRIEDTDQKRFDPNAEQDLTNSLKWLGLQWDEGIQVGGPYAPYRQSERKQLYQKYARQLVEQGDAFYCFCSSEKLEETRQAQQKNKETIRYDGTCRHLSLEEADQRIANGESYVVRFKMPYEGTTSITDFVRGEISFENQYLDDYVLVKSNGLAVYHLAAMVDDHLMNITHVFRGEEWLPTSPLHVRIYQALGWDQPIWVHLSLFLKPRELGKGKLSKRDTEKMKEALGTSFFIMDLKEMGYIPEGIINWVAMMGWSYDDKSDFFTLEELVNKFSIEKLNPSAVALDFKKLDYFNAKHIRELTVEDLAQRIKPFFIQAGINPTDEMLLKITPLVQPRLTTLNEAVEKSQFFFKDDIELSLEKLQEAKWDLSATLLYTKAAYDLIKQIDSLAQQDLDQPLRDLAKEMEVKPGMLFASIRNAVTGERQTPPLFETMEIIGKEKVFSRLEQAINLLES
jgi:glutamyl-tRNA synthetase